MLLFVLLPASHLPMPTLPPALLGSGVPGFYLYAFCVMATVATYPVTPFLPSTVRYRISRHYYQHYVSMPAMR